MKNLIKFSIVMVVLCITACTQTFENTSNEVQKKAQGRLVMKVGNESRTIKPTIGGSDVNTAVLTANGKEIKRWSGGNIISQIENTEDILLDVGNYDFTMTFRNAGNIDILTATTSKDIVAGNNSLNFNMKPVTTGTGDISITLTWDVASGIDKITAGLYDIGTNEQLVGFEDKELDITTSNEQISTALYSLSGVSVGQYIIKFKIYEGETAGEHLNTLSEVINVAAGIITSSQITLSKINTQYSITYNLNGGKYRENFTLTYKRNANEKITLPTANDITREGYEFGGWYDDDNNRITEIPSDTAKNISVTAKWYNAICDINNVCAVIASLSGTGPHDILVTGEMNSNFIAEKIKKEFDDNTNIKNVNLDLSQTTGMTEITPWAFEGMSGLSSVILPDSVTSIRDTAFQNCSNLTSINIPNGVTSIETKTFNGCSSLTEIIIPDSVTSIAYNAFYGCSSLISVTIGKGVKTIIGWAFGACSNLTTVNYKGTEDEWKEITIQGDGNSKLTGATINYNAITVTSDDVSTEISKLTEGGSYTIIVTGAITNATISAIKDALSGSNAKVNLDLSRTIGLTEIVNSAFESCYDLTSVTIPYSVTTIGTDAFYGCSSLKSVTIPDSVTSISANTFEYCDNLTSVTIGNGVTGIGYQAFYCCSSLTTVNYKGTQEDWNKITGIDQFGNATINYNYTGE